MNLKWGIIFSARGVFKMVHAWTQGYLKHYVYASPHLKNNYNILKCRKQVETAVAE